MDSYYPHCCRPPWIASVPFSHFRLRMYSYPRLFRSGDGRLFDGEKIRSILCFQFFEALGRGKSDYKIFRIVLSNREQRVERILGESLVFLFVFLKAATRRDEKGRIRISKVEVFFKVEKENESRGTKEREERTNSSQTIKTNDPVAPLVHSFAKINCGMTTDPTK